MGRYYSGDINGKFMFSIQPSDAGNRFGATEMHPNYIDYSVNRNEYKNAHLSGLVGSTNLRSVVFLNSLKPIAWFLKYFYLKEAIQALRHSAHKLLSENMTQLPVIFSNIVYTFFLSLWQNLLRRQECLRE